MRCEATTPPLDFDIDNLRDKYAYERDKRLRKEGTNQYVHVGEATRDDWPDFFEDDPYTPFVDRDPVNSDTDVLIVGGGFAGLLAGVHLRRAGVENIRTLDMAGDFGGVWYWNRYPGIQCDNEAYTYVPLLEEMGVMPRSRFMDGVDIYEHCRKIAHQFRLYEDTLFGTRIASIAWDQATLKWAVETNRGDKFHARFVIMAVGPWSKPKLPGIPGLGKFKGHVFHSARWDYDYTGGNPTDTKMDKLGDKRVAVIGTGATAIQIVPALARYAKEVIVFQRTPSAVDVRRDDPTDPDWVASLKPGWQKRRRDNFHKWAWDPFPNDPPVDDETCDFFTEVGRNTAAQIVGADKELGLEELIAIREQQDYAVMERVRRLVDEIVKDKATAESLKPYYRYMCKRPCTSNSYLQAFNQSNVRLVDVSESKGVERVTSNGLVANGEEYEVDCIIFASGFEISAQDQRASFGIDKIEGRDGLDLYEYWDEGYQTLHGMTATRFPGMFFTQVGVSACVTAMYEQQGEHIAYIIREAMQRGLPNVEPTREAQDNWVKAIRDNAMPNTFLAECTPGYYNNEGGGKGGIRAAVGEAYMPGFFAFDDILREWRESGNMPGIEPVK